MLRKIVSCQVKRPILISVAALAALAGAALSVRWQLTNGSVLWLVAPVVLATWRRQNLVTLTAIMALAFGVGWSRGSGYAVQVRQYDALFKQKVTIVGTALDDGAYGSREQLTFDLSNANIEGARPQQLIGVISVSGFGGGLVHRGDTVQAVGKMMPTLGGNQASMSFAELTVWPRPPNALEQVRRRFLAGLESELPEPLASFGAGLLVGQRNTLPASVSQVLLLVGLTHIIAVSGYNLTILLRAARLLLGRRSKFQTFSTSVLLMFVFLIVAGSSPSLTRAALVSGLSLVAWYYGREVKPLPLLLLAAAITVLANPLYLRGNVSWCLSFLSFFGVMIVAPALTRRLFGAREPPLVVAIAIESFCAELMTLPYVLHIFGQLSLVGIVANLLVAAFVPLAMLLALIAGLAGTFAATLAGWFAWPARLLLTYMLDVANLLSRIPHAFVQNRSFSTSAMLISYGIVAFVVFVLWKKAPERSTIAAKKPGTKGVAGHERTFQMVYD